MKREPAPAAAANDEAPSRIDPRVGRALDAMRARLDERWTVARLARVAAMSRAAFARRFLRDVGVPLLRWLTDARLARAASRLAASDARLADIAREVGYVSEFALSRAFRRDLGMPPSLFRRLS